MAKQDGRYSDQELAIIKATFNNEELLKALHKVLLQLPLSALDLSNLEVSITGKKNIHAIMRKMILPELTDDVPYRHTFDLTLAISFKDKAYEEIALNIKSNQIAIDYFDQQLKMIEAGTYQKKPKIVLSKLTKIKDLLPQDIYIQVMARNNIVGTVGGRLENLYLLATRIEKTPEQLEEERRSNSTK